MPPLNVSHPLSLSSYVLYVVFCFPIRLLLDLPLIWHFITDIVHWQTSCLVNYYMVEWQFAWLWQRVQTGVLFNSEIQNWIFLLQTNPIVGIFNNAQMALTIKWMSACSVYAYRKREKEIAIIIKLWLIYILIEVLAVIIRLSWNEWWNKLIEIWNRNYVWVRWNSHLL